MMLKHFIVNTNKFHFGFFKVQFLRDIGVQEDAIGRVLARFPSLLTYSLYKKIRPVVQFFSFFARLLLPL